MQPNLPALGAQMSLFAIRLITSQLTSINISATLKSSHCFYFCSFFDGLQKNLLHIAALMVQMEKYKGCSESGCRLRGIWKLGKKIPVGLGLWIMIALKQKILFFEFFQGNLALFCILPRLYCTQTCISISSSTWGHFWLSFIQSVPLTGKRQQEEDKGVQMRASVDSFCLIRSQVIWKRACQAVTHLNLIRHVRRKYNASVNTQVAVT